MIDVEGKEDSREEMSTDNKQKKRGVTFSDNDSVVHIPTLTDDDVVSLFYSSEDIKRMKDAAFLEEAGVTEEDIGAKGKDLFTIEQSGFKRSSLHRVAREVSPLRSPESTIRKKAAPDGGSLPTSAGQGEQPPQIPARPARERRPRGAERGIRRAQSARGPTRTDSLAARTNEGRSLRRGAPSRARSSMARPGGASGMALSDLSRMQAATRKLSSNPE